MSQRRVIEEYGRDVGFTIEQLNKLVATYKTLIDCAGDLNSIALASKSDVKSALKRSKKVGDLVDDLIDNTEFILCTWENYMQLKASYLNCKLDLTTIEVEVDEEIRLLSP